METYRFAMRIPIHLLRMERMIEMKEKNLFSSRNAVKVLMMLFDAVAVNLAYFLALVLRYYVMFQFNPEATRFVEVFRKIAPWYSVICVAVFYVFRLYNTMWKFGGLRDLNRICMACIVTAMIQVAGTLIFFERMSMSYYILGFAIQLAFIVCGRFAYRLYLLERNSAEALRKAATNVMVIGLDGIGYFARKQVEQDGSMKVVCLASKNDEWPNQYINGVPVISGLTNLDQAINKNKVDYVVIADEKLTAEERNQIKKVCDERKIEVQDFIEFVQNDNEAVTPIPVVKNEGGHRTIPFSPPDITDAEIEEVARAMKSGWITTGPRTKELERKLADFCHTSKVVCLNSATAAEELNFRVCGIGPGDEVIVPAYTYTASASAAIHCGAKVIFVDSQKDNCEMDYEKVAAAITEKTKAVVAVDLGGIVADYDKLYAAVESKRSLFRPKQGDDLGARIQQAIGRVLVFADCAHALGAQWHGKMAGEIADFTDFSFHAVKNFTTAEGGAATWRDIPGIDNEEMYHQYQLYSLHGQSKDALAKTKLGAWEYDIVGPWYKCNMTDIMAAIGLKQFDRYPGLVARRHAIIQKYDALCDELGVMHLSHEGPDFRSSGHLYITRIPGITLEQRQEIIVKLAELGVSTNVHYKPLPMMTAYKAYGWNIQDFPNAYDYYHNLITLPLHTCLTDEDVDYVCQCFKQVVAEYVKTPV